MTATAFDTLGAAQDIEAAVIERNTPTALIMRPEYDFSYGKGGVATEGRCVGALPAGRRMVGAA